MLIIFTPKIQTYTLSSLQHHGTAEKEEYPSEIHGQLFINPSKCHCLYSWPQLRNQPNLRFLPLLLSFPKYMAFICFQRVSLYQLLSLKCNRCETGLIEATDQPSMDQNKKPRGPETPSRRSRDAIVLVTWL